MTQTLNVTQARQQFSQLLNQAFRRERRIVIEKSGIPVAAIISAADFERFSQLEAERDQAFGVLDRMRSAFADVPLDEIEREVARAISEGRAENRKVASTAQP